MDKKFSIMKPLFKWAGGKNKMLKHYADIIPKDINAYCEPFFGGGAMFIHILRTYNPTFVKINDLNDNIMWIYRCIKNDYEEFITKIDKLESEYLSLEGPNNQNTTGKGKNKTHCSRWHYFMEVRNEHAFNYKSWSKPKEAATLYFLMKTGFNGIYQLNKNTAGRYGTPPGLMNEKKKVYDRDVVRWWHLALQNVNIVSSDWKEAVENCPENTFFFFDPPYRQSFADYGQGFSDEELLNLIDFADRQKYVMLCNRDDDGWFSNNKKALNFKHIDITYTAGRRKKINDKFEAKKAKEILLYRK
jgi:DNA adenine methylase